MASCEDELRNLNATIALLQSELDAATVDPCANPQISYGFGLHLATVFIILAASLLGVLSTLVGKHVACLRLSLFVTALGKTTGTGIVLACALVHMLQPSNQSLTSPCVPTAFNSDYTAYAYLYCLLAALAMQTIEVGVAGAVARPPAPQHGSAVIAAESRDSTTAGRIDSQDGDRDSAADACAAADCPVEPALAVPADERALHVHHDHHARYHVGHSHGGLHGEGGSTSFETNSLVAALMAEFGFTVHSVFIGLGAWAIGCGVQSSPACTVLCGTVFGVPRAARVPLRNACDTATATHILSQLLAL